MAKPLVKNTADSRQVRNARKQVRQERVLELDAIKAIAALPGCAGLKFFDRYLRLCKIFETTFTGRSDTFFLEGQRNVGLQLLADINEADPRIYVAMINMRKDEEDEVDGQRDDSDAGDYEPGSAG